MKYFTFKEMIASNTAKAKGIDNIPTWEQIDNLKKLIEAVLDPLREWYGKPIYVNSAFRSEALNAAVGGSKTSDHMTGKSADITTGDAEENYRLYVFIRDNLEFDQLIDEQDYSWVHVSYREGNNRKQELHL